MKLKWLGGLLLAGLVAGFSACYHPYGHHHYYSDYYSYGRGGYGHGEYLRHDRGRSRRHDARRDSRKYYHRSERDRLYW